MAKRVFFMAVWIFSGLLYAEFHSTISPVGSQIKKRMLRGGSWHKGCPVPLRDLRYIRVTHHDFDGKERRGELIVHREVAQDMVAIFSRLYEIGYPVRQMRLVSDFGGSDWRSIEADNTSAFNCRKATGSRAWSKHAYGRAIDLNPIENPYISRSGHISHKASLRFRKRVHRGHKTPADKALLTGNDHAVRIFKVHGWKWGGDWSGAKDYQHFFKP